MNHKSQLETLEPLRILELNANKSLTPYYDALKQILLRKDVKNRYVSIISICGKSRQGKSYLLNLLLRYCHVKYNLKRDVNEWLDENYGDLVKGFDWSHGEEPNTDGMLVWPKPFLTEINGKKIAIILIDTQGAFDYNSSIKDCAVIFALGSLLSSVQIYNVMRDFGQDQLGYLECFAGYGNFRQYNLQLCQKLLLLIRDWRHYKEKPFGKSGGEMVLRAVLDNNDDSLVSLNEQRQNIKDNFDTIDCFLLPGPGSNVAESYEYQGNLSEVNPSFVSHVKNLADSLFDDDNIILKSINGENVKGKALYQYFENYLNIYQSGDLPEISSIFQATSEASYKVAYDEAINYYQESMDIHTSSCLEENVLKELHDDKFRGTFEKYEQIRKLENSFVNTEYREKLQTSLTELFIKYQNININKIEEHIKSKSKEAIQEYENFMNGIYKSDISCFEEDLLQGKSEQACQQALSHFETSVELFIRSTNNFNDSRLQLTERFADIFRTYQSRNSERKLNLNTKLEENFTTSVTIFSTLMDNIYSNENEFLDLRLFNSQCNESKARAFANFENILLLLDSLNLYTEWKNRLENRLDELTDVYQNQNEIRREQNQQRLRELQEESFNIYKEILNNINNDNRPYIDENILNRKNVEGTNAAFEHFDELQLLLGSTLFYQKRRQELTKNLQHEFSRFRNNNAQRKRLFEVGLQRTYLQSINEYKRHMDHNIYNSDSRYLESYVLRNIHEQARGRGLNHYDMSLSDFRTMALVTSTRTRLQSELDNELQRYERYNASRRADAMKEQRNLVAVGAGGALAGGLIGGTLVGQSYGNPLATSLVDQVVGTIRTASSLAPLVGLAIGGLSHLSMEEPEEEEDERYSQ